MELGLILYATITQYELRERLKRNDLTYDAFTDLSASLGYKSSSSLRKMCERRSESNTAKLGFTDAMTIMKRTNDYRLLAWLEEELLQSQSRASQLDLFSEPLRTIKPEAGK
ncbi:MAG: hypothetical protein M1469_01190 [Bacteroidetes bacterium]|nr:hypothetical protein [Bacteroidota bacterium]